MIERRCARIDRRSGRERRRIDDLDYFLKGGMERRRRRERRSNLERRADWVRINKWYSVFPWEARNPRLSAMPPS